MRTLSRLTLAAALLASVALPAMASVVTTHTVIAPRHRAVRPVAPVHRVAATSTDATVKPGTTVSTDPKPGTVRTPGATVATQGLPATVPASTVTTPRVSSTTLPAAPVVKPN